MDHKIIYQIGKRDAVAELFMLIRQKGKLVALCDLAKQLVALDKENPNPHAKWYLENSELLKN